MFNVDITELRGPWFRGEPTINGRKGKKKSLI